MGNGITNNVCYNGAPMSKILFSVCIDLSFFVLLNCFQFRQYSLLFSCTICFHYHIRFLCRFRFLIFFRFCIRFHVSFLYRLLCVVFVFVFGAVVFGVGIPVYVSAGHRKVNSLSHPFPSTSLYNTQLLNSLVH